MAGFSCLPKLKRRGFVTRASVSPWLKFLKNFSSAALKRRFEPTTADSSVCLVRHCIFDLSARRRRKPGSRPAPEYEFRVFVSPVGPYYKGTGLSLIKLAVTDYDRAAPSGTGHVKVGGNTPVDSSRRRTQKNSVRTKHSIWMPRREHTWRRPARRISY